MQIVARVLQIHALLLGTFQSFFQPPSLDIFDPQLIEFMNAEPVDTEDWLETVRSHVWHIIRSQKNVAITCSSSSSSFEQESGFSPAETIHFLGSACLNTVPSRWSSLSSSRKRGRWKSPLLKCIKQGECFPFLNLHKWWVNITLCSSLQPFWHQETSFTEHNYCTDWGVGDGFRMIQSYYNYFISYFITLFSYFISLLTLFLLLLHQLHLGSSGIKSQRLGTSALENTFELSSSTRFSITTSLSSICKCMGIFRLSQWWGMTDH